MPSKTIVANTKSTADSRISRGQRPREKSIRVGISTCLFELIHFSVWATFDCMQEVRRARGLLGQVAPRLIRQGVIGRDGPKVPEDGPAQGPEEPGMEPLRHGD